MTEKPFQPFLRVFDTTLGQIVVMKENDEGPQIRVSVHPSALGFGICSVNMTFPGTDEGVEARDKAYDMMEEAHAVGLGQQLLQEVQELNEEMSE